MIRPITVTTRAPDGKSAQLHRHGKQDEFIFILEGHPILVTETEQIQLHPRMCASFPAQGAAHQLLNRTDRDVVFLEIGDRASGDEGSYPNDGIQAVLGPSDG